MGNDPEIAAHVVSTGLEGLVESRLNRAMFFRNEGTMLMNGSAVRTTVVIAAVLASSAWGQMGRRWPSEKKVISDPVTGIPLTFLTTDPAGDSKIYQTHQQWTADGQWLIFRGNRGTGPQAFAVNEETGDIIQVTENGYMGMLCAAHKSMKLFIMRDPRGGFGRGEGRGPRPAQTDAASAEPNESAAPPVRRGGRGPANGGQQVIEINLARRGYAER